MTLWCYGYKMILEGIADNRFSNSEGKNLHLNTFKYLEVFSSLLRWVTMVRISVGIENVKDTGWEMQFGVMRCMRWWAVQQRKTETAFIWECKPDLWEQEQDELFVDMTWRLNRYDCVHGNRDFSVLVPHPQHSVDCFCGTNLYIVETIEIFV